MILKAILVWLVIMVGAIVNGALREGLITPRTGPQWSHVISTVLLSALIAVVTWLFSGWIDFRSSGEALRVGLIWLVLTLAFEFLAGHFLFGTPWKAILADYNLARGRIWPLVLLSVLLAPVAVNWLKNR